MPCVDGDPLSCAMGHRFTVPGVFLLHFFSPFVSSFPFFFSMFFSSSVLFFPHCASSAPWECQGEGGRSEHAGEALGGGQPDGRCGALAFGAKGQGEVAVVVKTVWDPKTVLRFMCPFARVPFGVPIVVVKTVLGPFWLVFGEFSTHFTYFSAWIGMFTGTIWKQALHPGI